MPTVEGSMPGYPDGTQEWDGRRVVRTYNDVKQVIADNETQGPDTIIGALNLSVGDPFFEDANARLSRVGPAKRTEINRLVWRVPLFYTSQFPSEDANEAQMNTPPDQRRLRKRWSYETMQTTFTVDAIDADTAVANSAGEPIESTRDIVIPVLTVEKWKVNFDPDEILNYWNRTNTLTFYGAPAKTALLAGAEVEEDEGEVFNGLIYDRVRYTVKFKIPITEENKGWVQRYIDAGTVYKDSNKLKPYLSDVDATTGKRERIVGNLDGSGGKLTVGDPLVVLQFNDHEQANLNDLQLGP